jgi:hypothetical protein
MQKARRQQSAGTPFSIAAPRPAGGKDELKLSFLRGARAGEFIRPK